MSLLKEILYSLAGGAFAAFPLSFSGMVSLTDHFAEAGIETGGETALWIIAGAALAFLIRHFRKVFASASATVRMLFSMGWKGFSYEKEATADQKDAVMTLVSVLPTAAVLLAGKNLQVITADTDIITEGICFLLSGAVLIAACRSPVTGKADGTMHPDHALLIGAACALSVLPGISAVAAGTAAAVLLGYEPVYALRHSLFPALTAGLFSALSGALPASEQALGTAEAAACAAAAAVAGFAAVWVAGILIKKGKMTVFAYISLAIGLMTVIAGTVETASGMSLAELIAALKG